MTNYEIIMRESIELMKNGVLASIGDTGIPEEIHSFQEWRNRGLLVKKGEHAIAKFPVWIPYEAKVKTDAGEENAENEKTLKTTKFKMRDTAFFKASQCETAEERENAKTAVTEEVTEDVTEPEDPTEPEIEKASEEEKQPEATAPKAAKKITAKKTVKERERELKPIIKLFNETTLKKNPAGRLFVERSGKEVYICNGFIEYKTTLQEYRDFFKTSKSYYPELEDTDIYEIDDKDRIVKSSSSATFSKVWKDETAKVTTPATITEIVKDTGKYTIRGLMCGDEVVAVQDKYIQAFGVDKDWKGSTEIAPIACDDALILPVRADEEFKTKVKNANK